MTGPTHDVFFGGSRDGQQWTLDQSVTSDEVMAPAGDVYQRHPGLDGETTRAWVHVPSIQPTAGAGVHVKPQHGNKYLTLADLRLLVQAAERMGHADTVTIYGSVAWRGQLLTLGIKPEGKP